ncbi:5875_t:CDS:1, partial [Racocetra fulgida]
MPKFSKQKHHCQRIANNKQKKIVTQLTQVSNSSQVTDEKEVPNEKLIFNKKPNLKEEL